jgi:hypothetical protein
LLRDVSLTESSISLVTFFGEAKNVTGPRRERRSRRDERGVRAAARKSIVVDR